jgi:ribosome maturation protein Sdo1
MSIESIAFDQQMLATNALQPKTKNRLPYPLENIEENLAEVYFSLDIIRKRIEVVKRNNVTSLTPARLKRLKKMQYKVNTAMSVIRALTRDLDDFWI